MKKKREEPISNIADSMESWFGIGLAVLFVFLFFFALKSFFYNASDHLDDKASQKAHCQTHWSVTEAKTEFAAKQAFEKCMNNK
tara:strand:+ start:572 stop:823 length:252 start_codon:yes stop_codon:yes gene_type:complete